MKQFLIPTENECRQALKMLRDEEITIKMIAESIGVSEQTIIRWCKGSKISTNSRIKFGKLSAEIARAKNRIIPLDI